MRISVLAALVVPFSLGACAYPVTTAEQGAAPSGLYFTGVPEDARVLVDMADAGLAAAYDGKKAVLEIKPGRRRVIVQSNSSKLYDQNIYVGPGSRMKIKVGER
jgi:hypothetical protein